MDATRMPRRSLESVSIWALVITLAVAVFAFAPLSSLSFAAVKAFVLAAGALVVLALYIFTRLSRGNIVFPPVVIVGALWLPVIAYLLSALFSGTSFGNAFWGTALESDTAGFMLVLAFLGTLAACILRRPEHYRSFLSIGAWVFGAATAVQAVILVAAQFTTRVSPMFSILGSFQDLAVFLGIGIIGILISFRFLSFPRRVHRLLFASGVLALVLLAVANISTVWVLLGLVSLGLFVEAVMRRGPKAADADFDEIISIEDELPAEPGVTSQSLLMPLAVLAVSLFFIVGGTLGGALANALHVNVLSVSPSWQSTLETARSVYTTSPFFGTGPGTFGADWLKYRDASLNASVFWNVDFPSGIGFVPTSIVTTGLVGALAWIVLFAAFLVFGLRMLLLRAPQDSFTRYVATLSFLATLFLFAIAIFSVPGAFVLTLGFVFAGLFASTMRFSARGRQRGIIFSRSPRLGFVVVFSLTLILLASVVAAYALVEHGLAIVELAKANSVYAVGNLDAADQYLQRSISFAPTAIAYQTQADIASVRVSDVIASTTLSRTAAQQAFQTALSNGINAALTATSLAPADYRNWLALGNLYAQAVPVGVSGAYENAKTAYDKAATLNPTNPQIPFLLAQLNIANKDNKAAEEDLSVAISLKQDYTDAIFLLSQLEVQDGNVKDALASALAAAYFTPNNPSILFQVGILYAAQDDLANAAVALSAAVDANPQFANARYFLSAVYAKQGDLQNALAQMQAIADSSSDNASAVASQLEALKAGRNPFPANLLSITSSSTAK